MRSRLSYEPQAISLLRRLPPDLKPLIKAGIEGLRSDPYIGKELRLELAGYRSLRARRYRVIYRVDEEKRVVEIHHFGPRATIYDSLRRWLARR